MSDHLIEGQGVDKLSCVGEKCLDRVGKPYLALVTPCSKDPIDDLIWV